MAGFEVATEGIAAWAVKSESGKEINAMISLVRPDVAARVEDFDADPWLLNTPSGVVDLQTVGVRAPDPSALMRRITAARFDPEARCEVFEAILERALPDPEIRAMVQRSYAYAILGVQQLKAAFIPYGEKDSAKSTLISIFRRTLGSYAATAKIETFTSKRDAAAASPDIARLVGARMIVINEIPDGSTLRSDLFKTWTGGKDMVNFRALYKGEGEFLPQGTLFFVGNHRPAFDAGDDAAWRRVVPMPFRVSIPESEQDPEIAERVNLDAVLTWGLQSIPAVLEFGINPPAAVLAVREEYRAEANVLSGFVRERLIRREGKKLPKEKVRNEARTWLESNKGIFRSTQPTDQGLGMLLAALGVKAGGKQGAFYVDWDWAEAGESAAPDLDFDDWMK